jgi:hypothetical protein
MSRKVVLLAQHAPEFGVTDVARVPLFSADSAELHVPAALRRMPKFLAVSTHLLVAFSLLAVPAAASLALDRLAFLRSMLLVPALVTAPLVHRVVPALLLQVFARLVAELAEGKAAL